MDSTLGHDLGEKHDWKSDDTVFGLCLNKVQCLFWSLVGAFAHCFDERFSEFGAGRRWV